MNEKIRWGIIGTGNIAHKFAAALAHSRTGSLHAVASRDAAKARAFAAELASPTAYGSYEALLADRDVQAVYISTPHPMHERWAIAAAQAGKHILCEKPLTLSAAGAQRVIDAARANDVFLMEAFMYRCHPKTHKLVELLREGAIGQVRMIQATFSFQAPRNPASRLYDPSLGGGGILDVGGYCMSMARLLAGAAQGRPFAEPTELVATGRLDPECGTDVLATACLKFPGDILATLSCGVSVAQDNHVRVFGDGGSLDVNWPWIPGREGGPWEFTLCRKDAQPQTVAGHTDQWLYGLEADTVAAGIPERQSPAMPWDDTLGNMRALDAWRAAIGVKYANE